MLHAKLVILAVFAAIAFVACFDSKPTRTVIAENKTYPASLFRQHCAICHGPEGDGKTLDDGKVVPSLREGELKFKTKAEIYKQISAGGNGMVPFRDQLTERELQLMTDFVHDELRKQ